MFGVRLSWTLASNACPTTSTSTDRWRGVGLQHRRPKIDLLALVARHFALRLDDIQPAVTIQVGDCDAQRAFARWRVENILGQRSALPIHH